MNNLFLVMAGGALGAGARHLVGSAMLSRLGPGFPWGTLTVNLAGGMLMGLLAGILARQGGSEPARLLIGVGILGGFTTFSAFSAESLGLLQRGDFGLALLHSGAHLVGALACTALGFALSRAVLG